ncbi:MAG: flavodoxin family protein, partial [Methanobrevibacter sp.]|nr:flavodoxin family protein [Methanobrevibacter sp.]
KLKSAFIYTMNITEERVDEIGLKNALGFHQEFLERILGEKPELLFSYNTYQFTDYDKYEHSIFSKEDKLNSKLNQFPIDCNNAFNLGVKIGKSLNKL